MVSVLYCFKTTPLRGSTFDELSLFGQFDFVMSLLCFSIAIWSDNVSIGTLVSVLSVLSVASLHISVLSVDPLQIRLDVAPF